MNDKEIQRAILQFAYDHQHDYPTRIVSVKDILEIAVVEINRLRHNLTYLKREGLIENISDDYMTIRLTNSGINLVDNKETFDSQFPLLVTVPEESKRMILNVESLLQGKHDSVLEQFRKAVRFLYEVKPPDSLNCVKEAVGAVEGIARILCNEPKKTLSDLIPHLRQPHLSHPAMSKILDAIYAVRSDEPGAAHAAHKTSSFEYADAEFILNVSASVIIYLMRQST